MDRRGLTFQVSDFVQATRRIFLKSFVKLFPKWKSSMRRGSAGHPIARIASRIPKMNIGGNRGERYNCRYNILSIFLSGDKRGELLSCAIRLVRLSKLQLALELLRTKASLG